MGESLGMMNIAVPSIIIRMMRQKFDQQWSVRKTESTDQEQSRVLDLIRGSEMDVDARLDGPSLLMEDLMRLEEGDVLSFDYSLQKPVHLSINGKCKFRGQIVTTGRKKGYLIESAYSEVGQALPPVHSA
jgi:flagellar motor switch protein FliM